MLLVVTKKYYLIKIDAMSSNFMHSCNEFEMQRVEITDSLSNGLLATLALSVTIFFGCFIIFLIVRRFREDDLKC